MAVKPTIHEHHLKVLFFLPFSNIGGFHTISGDTNNTGEMNKCWWTNKAS